jgi:hypothetical protein
VHICLNEQHGANILRFGARAPHIRNIGISWLSERIEKNQIQNTENKLSDITEVFK